MLTCILVVRQRAQTTSPLLLSVVKRSISHLPPGPAKKVVEKSHWTLKEEERLILFLVSWKSEAGDGGSFKSVVWMAAVQEMAKVPPTKDIVKISAICSSKYSCVCILTFILSLLIIRY